MASKNHSTVKVHTMGNLKLSVIDFTDIDNGDTYDSGIPGAVAYWGTATDDPTINREGVNITYTNDVIGTVNAGRFTLYTSEDNRVVKLYVLSRTA